MARTISIELVGESSKFQRALDQTQSKLESFGNKARDVGKKMSTFVTLPIVGAGVAAFNMAGDFAESFSKMETVFGASSKQIADWSKTAASAFGLSQKEAVDAAGTFGNMFTQLGIGAEQAAGLSTRMIELAADLGSFHNADITEVINAQTSAFRGEYDALQRFIPTINAATVEQKALEMTGKAATKEITAQEKALAVQTLMMEGAGAATGDFARTSDSAANQQRILTAQFKDAATQLGTNLLPIGQQILAWLAGLIEKYNTLSPGVQKAILVVGGFLAVLGPLIGTIGALSTALAFLAANPVALVIAAVAALAAGLVYAYKHSETFRNVIDTAFRVVAAAVRTAWDVIRPILNKLADAFGFVADKAGGFLNIVGKVGGAAGGLVGKLPGFQTGGVVPGPLGAPQLAVVHGGETITPPWRAAPGGGSVVVNVNVAGSVVTQQDVVDAVHTGLLAKQRRTGNLGFEAA